MSRRDGVTREPAITNDVRRVGRSNTVARSSEDNERIDRALAQLTNEPSSVKASKVAFVARPRSEPAALAKERMVRQQAERQQNVIKPVTKGPLGIASLIAASAQPPNWLLIGLQECLERSLASKPKNMNSPRRSAEEVRAEMSRATKAAKALQDLLRDVELLGHLSPDHLPNRDRFFAGLNWIAKRTAIAALPGKRGRPKADFDLSSPQLQCAIMVCVSWRMMWQKPLRSTDIDGQQACEMFWTAIGGRPHQPSKRERRSKQHGIIEVKLFDIWGQWTEKAHIILEAMHEDILPDSSKQALLSEGDRLNFKFAREVERIFQHARSTTVNKT